MDLVLISEPLYNPGNWIMTNKGNAAIWVTGYNGLWRMEDGDRVEDDFSAVRIKNMTIISVYISPNTTEDQYALKVERIVEFSSLEKRNGRSIILGGDFNARSPVWGSNEQNQKGAILLDVMLRRDILPVRPIGGPTFERGNSVSYLDFVAVTPELVRNERVISRVLSIESASDHKYILTDIKAPSTDEPNTNYNFSRWRITTHGLNRLKTALDRNLIAEGINEGSHLSEEQERRFLSIIKKICEESLDKVEAGKGKRTRNNPWWNQEIKEVRTKVHRMRRKIQKARRKNREEERELLTFLYKKEKKRLQYMIKKEKDRVWKEMCEAIEKDPWGKPYKLVIKRVKKSSPPAALSISFAEEVMKGLFPQIKDNRDSEQENREQELVIEQITEQVNVPRQMEFPEITAEEVIKASRLLKTGKAPGKDGVPPEIVKAIAQHRADRIAALYNGIIERSRIPNEWKHAKTILLRKDGKDPSETSAYRPICIIDAIAKLLEYIVKDRLHRELGDEPFNKDQYGFYKGKSAVQAMEKIRIAANESSDKQRFAAIIALDVKNAFNSLKWENIIDELENRNLPKYLIELIKDYFKNRTVFYKSEETEIRIKMQMGVPQGSVLGPFLWNLVYDGLLQRPNPPMSSRLAFADDVVITAQGATVSRMRQRAEFLIEDSKQWMESAGLELAEGKTELMMLNRKSLGEGFCIKVGEAVIEPKSQIKYLGVIFDDKKSFRAHIKESTNKAIKTMAALSSLMTNSMRTRQAIRKLYYMTMESIVLYGAPIWAEAAEVNANRTLLNRTQRIGLSRVVSSYRTVPSETLCVLAGITPWSIKIKERRKMFEWEEEIRQNLREITENIRSEEPLDREYPDIHITPNLEDSREETQETRAILKRWIKKKVKEESEEIWQRKWEEDIVGRWTYRLIPDIKKWKNRKHGELDFYLTQALTGHGVFNVFRKRIGKAESEECWYQCGVPDTPEHTLFSCQRWRDERRQLCNSWEIREEELNPERTTQGILKKEAAWRSFATFCRSVLKEKEEEERKREKQGQDNPETRGTEADLESRDLERMRDL